jgi:CelD/BcsL family acetyltransferase involved in cellulose biosynthesis
VVDDLDDLAALARSWSALLHRTPNATAYASPEFVLTWYRHFERPGGVYAVTVWRGDTLVGLAPFARTTIGWGPAQASLLVSAGTENGDYGDPLVGPHPVPVADALVDHLAGLTRRWTAINMRRLRLDGPMWAALYARPDLRRTPMGHVAEAAVVRLDLMDDPETAIRKLAKRHDVPRTRRRLAEAHGPVDYVAGDHDLTGALDDMRSMLARRWAEGEGPKLFRTPMLEAYTRESVSELVAAGLARVDSLTAGGRRLTVSLSFVVDDRSVGDNTAADPDYNRFAPGQTMIAALLEHCRTSGIRELDMRAGDFPYKQRWANATIRTHSLALTPPGRQGDALLQARRVAMSVRARRLARLAAG